MLLRSSRIVVTPGQAQPYKVVLERETKGISEHPVATIREGEALIRTNLPTWSNSRPDAWNDCQKNSVNGPPENEKVA